MDLIADLLARTDAFCARTGMKRWQVAKAVVNNGRFFNRIEAGSDCNTGTYTRFLKYFEEQSRGGE